VNGLPRITRHIGLQLHNLGFRTELAYALDFIGTNRISMPQTGTMK
jgi:hypothetical protein